MDREGLRIAADATHLEVDDPTASELEGLPRGRGAGDALVQADVRRELSLKTSVIDEVVVRERLFDHEKPVGVEPPQVRKVREVIRRVGVHGERQIAEAFAHPVQDRQVPAGLDLQLDPLVPEPDVSLDPVEELTDPFLNSETHPRRDPIAHPSEG